MLPSCRSARAKSHGNQRLIILGIDGMDPQLLRRFMREGKMPNFAKLEAQGDFRPLTTSIPPQSPVAWSNLITGMNAGGHGIFDFIHRDPKTLAPYFSASRVEGPKHAIHFGSWAIPLGMTAAPNNCDRARRSGRFLISAESPTQFFEVPRISPRSQPRGKLSQAWALPICAELTGHFSFYTDDPHGGGRCRRRRSRSSRAG